MKKTRGLSLHEQSIEQSMSTGLVVLKLPLQLYQSTREEVAYTTISQDILDTRLRFLGWCPCCGDDDLDSLSRGVIDVKKCTLSRTIRTSLFS